MYVGEIFTEDNNYDQKYGENSKLDKWPFLKNQSCSVVKLF